MIQWESINNNPPEKELLLIDTEDDEGNPGGILLGGVTNGKWYWIKGIEELELRNYSVIWWALVTEPPNN